MLNAYLRKQAQHLNKLNKAVSYLLSNRKACIGLGLGMILGFLFNIALAFLPFKAPLSAASSLECLSENSPQEGLQFSFQPSLESGSKACQEEDPSEQKLHCTPHFEGGL